VDAGLKHDSAIYCDALVSLPKSKLTGYAGSLSPDAMEKVNAALRSALALG
jgi:mRNA interferase MazF